MLIPLIVAILDVLDPSSLYLYQWLSFVIQDLPCILFWLVYVYRDVL